jgi:hypothetical protein
MIRFQHSSKTKTLATAVLTTALALSTAFHARAADYEIYVANKNTPAAETGAAKSNGTSVFFERTLHRALEQAATLLAKKGNDVVTVRVAAGDFSGKIGSGIWEIPTVQNPNGTLRLLGGYDSGFTARDPFRTPSKLVTSAGRNGAFIAIGNRSQLSELGISGFLFDAAPSNKYDAKNNSLLRAQSRTYTMLAFSQLQTNHLVVADNIFINGAHGVLEPFIAPVSANTTVDIVNNFFIGNVKALQIGSGMGYRGNTVKVVNFKNNSVIANWPYNPDPTSSLVSAINLYHREGAQHLDIEGNLFAYNFGGALQHDWPENRMPKLTLKNNLFFKNANLFQKTEPGAGVIVGKFGTNPIYAVLDLETIEDDLGYDVKGNVTLDPQLDFDVQMSTEEDGDNLQIEGWAQKLEYDPAQVPLPGNAQAAAFGVQPDRIWKP